MVTKLCRLLSQYSIEIIPPQKGDKELALSLTSPSMPQIKKSILADNIGFAKIFQLPDSDPDQKVYTINKQLITKVYTRKKLKIKSQQASESGPVFGLVQQEYTPQSKPGNGLKHSATPISVQNLRRSKRG
jgi:hypothetical protein